MQRPIKTGTVPPGGVWRYKDDETGEVITHPYLDQVKMRAHKHRITNVLPIGTNWEEQLEDNICRNTSTATCVDIETGVRRALALGKRFSTAMLNWARSGFKLVDDETLAARRIACEGDETHERCSAWQSTTRGFGFGRCGKCGCVGSLKTALATEKCPLGRWPL